MEFSDSDLAAECGVSEGEGIRLQKACAQGCEILRVRVESEAAGKPQGRYVTVECGDVCELDELGLERVCCVLAVEIREMARRVCGTPLGRDSTVLVVGLGNAEMTADALGPKTVKNLPVTRHLSKYGALLSDLMQRCEVAAISPGVPGQTGVESLEMIRGAVHAVSPDLVIAVDALAARSPARLASTVQICDNGIQPGGGVGKARGALTRESVGVPVMAVGMPTVVSCARLVRDALERAGCERAEGRAAAELEKGRPLFVCPKEIDLVVERAGILLGKALEKAFS